MSKRINKNIKLNVDDDNPVIQNHLNWVSTVAFIITYMVNMSIIYKLNVNFFNKEVLVTITIFSYLEIKQTNTRWESTSQI